jgi:hypothetical protein
VKEKVASILGLYDGYCATANAAVATTTESSSKVSSSVGSSIETGVRAAPSTSSVDSGSASASTSTVSSAPEAKSPEAEQGLSKSNIIALATGLGIGIPSLLVAVIALVYQLKKPKAAVGERLPSAQGSVWGSEVELRRRTSWGR